ncbi:MAG: CD225/dispanin family protein [Pirellulaceae bacterium]|nr:CD225/dispanin family protein [Pirellulaceae bacterium]
MTEMKICPQCSEESEPQFEKCWNCGTSLDPGSESVDQTADTGLTGIRIQPQAEEILASPSLGWSVLALLLVFPTGLMAVIYSSIAEIALVHEKISKAQHYAHRAQTWRMFTFAVVAILLAFFFLVGF